jgi:two-component system, chemotaxis family, sensor kinase CheA
MRQGGDPYKYFRIEAREILDGLTRGLLDLEKQGGEGEELIGQCFRLAHTLKGAARVVKQLKIAEVAHAIEDALAPYRETGEPISPEYVTELLKLLEIIREEVALIEAPTEPARTRTARPREGAITGGEQFETLRIEITEMDEILDGISEAAVQLGPLRSGADAVAHAQRAALSISELVGARMDDLAAGSPGQRWLAKIEAAASSLRAQLAVAQRDIGSGISRIHSEFNEIKTRASTLRLVPASAAFGPLELAARDAAEWLGKQVDFEAVGGDTRLEGHILSALRDALLHIVRNAVDHGIELPADRIAAGKPIEGRVKLRVERRGSRVAFICSDDGRGVDLSAVRRSAAEKGLIAASADDSLSTQDLLMLIFQAGVSTSDMVTEISGRGVGLDVVRETVAQLKGEVTARTELHVGTTIELVVPVSLSSLTALMLTAEGMTVLIPLDSVCGTLRMMTGDVIRTADSESILFEGKIVPYAPMVSVLGARASASSGRQAWSAVVVQWGGQRTALGVDRLLGTMDVIIKPLPVAAGQQPVALGAAFDAQGDPVLVLDPQGIVGAARYVRPLTDDEPSRRVIAPILVIDDSLTTRMLEQSILESAGYEVDLASSGEEGLKKAQGRRYSLFIVDIEMPGINGYEFVTRAKADPALRRVPVIMVTSLASVADKKRGADAGVDAYIVKGEFDQKSFVSRVASLVEMSDA